MTEVNENRPPLPPFDRESAAKKVRLAEDGWNNRDPLKVAQAYTINSSWRNRSEFINGRDQIVEFLSIKWKNEREYRLIKQLWAFQGNRIAVRFAYESKNSEGQWIRSFGNENWQFNDCGLMTHRHASINDLLIRQNQRLFHWPLGRRPDDHASLSELGL
ncbi:MAG: nuclear transport factor 2 (NTF2) superfamily protein [Arenicella sp.]|jgi:nuclear transport factor 2 (NTF2) superfamily protein